MKIGIGGTFNILHKGHKKLINEALKFADTDGLVFIGVTTDEFLKKKKKSKPYEIRVKNLASYLKQNKYFNRVKIKPISDKYGPTLTEDFDAIIVSPETYETVIEINDLRLKKGLKPIKIVKIPYVLAEDGKPISTSRIIKKEIDKDGNILPKD